MKMGHWETTVTKKHKSLSRAALVGYPAGVITGVAYGLNPLFAMPLINQGASVESVLFCRYALALLIMFVWIYLRGERPNLEKRQFGVLIVLGILYTLSSLTLFEAYNYISSGVATTLVFLYPPIVALVMVLFRVVPSWPVWLSIIATFAGVVIMTQGDGDVALDIRGVAYAIASAVVYALFIVIINRSRTISSVSNTTITTVALMVGTMVFLIKALFASVTSDIPIDNDAMLWWLDSVADWANVLGLAVLPTIVSTTTLAVATRNIGATKASVLGVFEPITAILVGTIAFGEPLTPAIVTGITIATAAVVFMIVLTKR